MEASQFDELTKKLAGSVSRRGALKAALATAAGGLFALNRARTTEAATCPAGHALCTAPSGTSRCILCPSGTSVYVPGNGPGTGCQCCPSAATCANSGVTRCAPACPGGTTLNPGSCSCVATCSEGQMLCNGNCVKNCPNGAAFDAFCACRCAGDPCGGVCCDAGQACIDGSCCPTSQVCGGGTTCCDSSSVCVGSGQSSVCQTICPKGTTYCQGNCIPNCPGGQILNAYNCLCQCVGFYGCGPGICCNLGQSCVGGACSTGTCPTIPPPGPGPNGENCFIGCQSLDAGQTCYCVGTTESTPACISPTCGSTVCTTTADCAPGEICSGGACVTGCNSAGDCAKGQACFTQGCCDFLFGIATPPGFTGLCLNSCSTGPIGPISNAKKWSSTRGR